MNSSQIAKSKSVEEILKGLNLESSKEMRTLLSERIKTLKYSELNDEQRAIFDKYVSFSEERNEFFSKVLQSYYTANRARSIALKHLREYANYHVKKRKFLGNIDDIAKIATRGQLSKFSDFSVERFEAALRSHNIVLKFLLTDGKLPSAIEPKRYIRAAIQAAVCTEDTYRNRLSLELPKK